MRYHHFSKRQYVTELLLLVVLVTAHTYADAGEDHTASRQEQLSRLNIDELRTLTIKLQTENDELKERIDELVMMALKLRKERRQLQALLSRIQKRHNLPEDAIDTPEEPLEQTFNSSKRQTYSTFEQIFSKIPSGLIPPPKITWSDYDYLDRFHEWAGENIHGKHIRVRVLYGGMGTISKTNKSGIEVEDKDRFLAYFPYFRNAIRNTNIRKGIKLKSNQFKFRRWIIHGMVNAPFEMSVKENFHNLTFHEKRSGKHRPVWISGTINNLVFSGVNRGRGDIYHVVLTLDDASIDDPIFKKGKFTNN